jgi:hypothetical protein
MQSILHIGMPKTGSTTLQRTFHASGHVLRKQGICYPHNLSSSPASHRIMASRMMPADSFPRHLQRCRPQEKADEFYHELKEQISVARKGGHAQRVILSSEILFRPPRNGYTSLFRESVYDLLGDRCQVVAYLRAPSSVYLALLQQKLKASRKIRPPKPPDYKGTIFSYCDLFGDERIRLRVFDRTCLFRGDIVQDFCHHFLPEHTNLTDQLVPAGETNMSLSAESMALCLLFQKEFSMTTDSGRSRLSRKVIAELRHADALVKAKRPELLPSIRECIDRAAAVQMTWLRDEWGIEFPGYDYGLCSQALRHSHDALLDQADSLEKIVRLEIGLVRDLARLLATQTRLAEIKRVARWSATLADSSELDILELLQA